jgi:hypothetical protein
LPDPVGYTCFSSWFIDFDSGQSGACQGSALILKKAEPECTF